MSHGYSDNLALHGFNLLMDKLWIDANFCIARHDLGGIHRRESSRCEMRLDAVPSGLLFQECHYDGGVENDHSSSPHIFLRSARKESTEIFSCASGGKRSIISRKRRNASS